MSTSLSRSAAVRRRATAHLTQLGVADAAMAEVLVGELLTNAIVHGGFPRHISVERTGHSLRVEVADGGPVPFFPESIACTAGSTGGLGIVDALSSRWGCDRAVNGKVVWFEVPARTRGPLPLPERGGTLPIPVAATLFLAPRGDTPRSEGADLGPGLSPG